jgi:hypothetical protein
MFAVVVFNGLLGNVRSQSILGVRKFRESELGLVFSRHVFLFVFDFFFFFCSRQQTNQARKKVSKKERKKSPTRTDTDKTNP